MGQELATMREKYQVLCGVLDERGRRVWAAAEANSLPHGGVSLVANATGLSRSTIHAGLRELGNDRGHPMMKPHPRNEMRCVSLAYDNTAAQPIISKSSPRIQTSFPRD